MLMVPFAESPLHNSTSLDYDIFTTIARGWLDGHIPYTELFDSKGPYQFLMTAAGLAILHGKWGLWLLLSVNLAITLELLYRIGIALGFAIKHIFIALTLCLLIAIGTVDAGATVEEWCLIPLTLPLLLIIKSVQTRIRPVRLGLVCGLCIGFIAMTRLNNAAIPTGALIGLAIILIRRLEYSVLAKGIAATLAGIAIAVAPAVIYFKAHNALDMMLFATFTYNIDYKLNWQSPSGNSVLLNAARLLCAPIAALAMWHHHRTNPIAIIIVTTALTVVCVFITGAGYCHYYTAILPLIFIAFCYALQTPVLQRIVISVALIAPFANAIIRTLDNQWHALNTHDTRPELKKILAIIPYDELNSVYQLNTDIHTDYLTSLGAIPVGRYFTLQNDVAATSPRAAADIVSQFDAASPLWIISGTTIEESVLSQFAKEYTTVSRLTPDLLLYQKKISQNQGENLVSKNI